MAYSHNNVCFEGISHRLKKKEVNMWLGHSAFLEVPFLPFLALHTKRKRCDHMGPTPCYLQSLVVSVCQNFKPVAPFFFLAKV